MKKTILTFLLIVQIQSILAQVKSISNQPIYRNPLPSPYQLKWHDNNYYLFMHFGPNTFTDKEWGDGKEKTTVFNPTLMDCNQWCKIAKAAGAKGIIITAKHHDGFCLWPSKYSTHTVGQSDFKRDVLAELSAACKKNGLLFGVYLSPWDRNHPDYGTPQYNTVFVNMLKEIFQNYGPIWELWWDGANGEGPNGKKQIYDWQLFESTVRAISPQTVIFSDIGPDIRWIGNENGKASTTNWNLLDTIGFKRGLGAPLNDTLQQGNFKGAHYIPAEADVSIRPSWFYHERENNQVKSGEELMKIYLNSVGRGANLLLNVPPDDKGLISAYDSAALMNFYIKRKPLEGPNLLKNASLSIGEPDRNNINKPYSWYYILKQSVLMNGLILEEDLKYGQKIIAVNITVSTSGETKLQQKITTVGSKRIIVFPEPINASEIAIVVLESKGLPIFKTIRAF
jgi:alpha-L-fucosidase